MTHQAEGRGSRSRSRSRFRNAHSRAPAAALPSAGTVLVVEDDPSVAELLTTALGARHYTVIVTRSGHAALRAVDAAVPDVMLLDLGLPDIDGLDVCRRIRQHSTLPIIVVTADGDEQRKVEALDLGADDYVTKPFSMPELMARLRVALRHHQGPGDRPGGSGTDGVLQVGTLRVDTGAHEVTVDGEAVHLTQKEFLLVELLAARPGALLTHAVILEQVWATGGGSSEALRVHVAKVRRKLGTGAGVELRTEPGIGYRLVATGPA